MLGELLVTHKRMPVARANRTIAAAPQLMMAKERIDDLLNLFAVLTLRHRVSNPGALHTQSLARTGNFKYISPRSAAIVLLTLDSRFNAVLTASSPRLEQPKRNL